MREINTPKTIRTSIYFGQSVIDAEVRHAGLGDTGGANWPLGYITYDETSFRVGYFSIEKKLYYLDIVELTATWTGNFKVKMKNNDDTFILSSSRASLIFDKFLEHNVNIPNTSSTIRRNTTKLVIFYLIILVFALFATISTLIYISRNQI